MHIYISILRGINVSGKNIIKMDSLQEMYVGVGFRHVQTYVQSGNVIFGSNSQEPAALAEIISKQIKKDFDLDVPVIVFSIDTLEHIIRDNPLKNQDKAFLHVTFLSAAPKTQDLAFAENKKLNGEEIQMSRNAVYLYCPNGYGKTKLNNTFLEKQLGVTTTTRNWKTTNELLLMAQQTTRQKLTIH